MIDEGSKVENPDYYKIMRNSLVKLYFKDIAFTFMITIIAEFSAVYYTFLIGGLIRFIKADNTSTSEGIKLIAVFIFFMLTA